MTYSPQYIALDDVPVQVPDDFTQDEKRDAIEMAEVNIELDLNDGAELSSEALAVAGHIIETAVKQRATCELVKGTEDNDDVALTDLDDGGSTKSEYAQDSFCDKYDELIDKSEDSGVRADEAEGADDSPYVYNTGEHR